MAQHEMSTPGGAPHGTLTRERARRTPVGPGRLLTWLPLPVGAALWAWSLPRIRFHNLGDFGLLDRFPVAFYASLAVLTVGFIASLRRAGTAPWWPLTYSLGMLFALKAPTALLYDTVRYAWASKHDAVIARLLTEGTVHPHHTLNGGMSAYDQWPGFFSLNAALIKAFGVQGAAVYTNWAPVIYGALTLPILVVIYRTFTDDWRLVWTAVWIFQLANWVGQDYLSPQGFAYVLFLAVFAVVLRHFVRPGSAGSLRDRDLLDPAAAPAPPATTWQQRAVGVVLLAPLIAAINSAHQLTPVMLCVTLFALCLTRRYRNIGLFVVAVVIMGIWDLTMGRPLFVDTMKTLSGQLGDLLSNAKPGIGGNPTGEGAELVGVVNIVMVVALGALAVVAVVLRRRLARSALPLLLAAVAPAPLLAVNNYGGEMVFRVYLFGLPGSAFFAAAALVPSVAYAGKARRIAQRVMVVALPAGILVLLAGFLPSYYGKESMQYAPPQEVAFVERAYDRAPTGSLVMAATGSFPGAYYHYNHYDHWFFTEQDAAANRQLLKDPGDYLAEGIPAGCPAYIILTPTQRDAVQGEGYLPPGGYTKLVAALKASPHFKIIEEGSHGLLLQHLPIPTAPEALPDDVEP
ncbi:hypothetical protein [Streptomyces fuscigenes]|uniref:hypothetical protein n=1 Tax=Streptomyces fuscigenes TaxID=1528880 RepID=UPI0027E10157|nr:hypothetical protein [Streptomyces fuscigenes]